MRLRPCIRIENCLWTPLPYALVHGASRSRRSCAHLMANGSAQCFGRLDLRILAADDEASNGACLLIARKKPSRAGGEQNGFQSAEHVLFGAPKAVQPSQNVPRDAAFMQIIQCCTQERRSQRVPPIYQLCRGCALQRTCIAALAAPAARHRCDSSRDSSRRLPQKRLRSLPKLRERRRGRGDEGRDAGKDGRVLGGALRPHGLPDRRGPGGRARRPGRGSSSRARTASSSSRRLMGRRSTRRATRCTSGTTPSGAMLRLRRCEPCCGPRLRTARAAAVDVHLQGAVARRRGHVAPGRDVLADGPGPDRGRALAGPRRRHAGERLRLGAGRVAPGAAAARLC